jgi:hypothetical protein
LKKVTVEGKIVVKATKLQVFHKNLFEGCFFFFSVWYPLSIGGQK